MYKIGVGGAYMPAPSHSPGMEICVYGDWEPHGRYVSVLELLVDLHLVNFQSPIS